MSELNSDPRGKENSSDARVYVAHPEGWSAHVKQTWEKDYCFQKRPGEDYFHLLMHGEIYLEHDEERYCLDCALRKGILTHNRINWVKGGKSP